MGIWHGPEWHYILYGLYHASLLCGYDAFARWNKKRKFWPDGRLAAQANIVLTFHVFAFGLLIFSGRLEPPVPPRHDEVADKIDCQQMSPAGSGIAKKAMSRSTWISISTMPTWAASWPINSAKTCATAATAKASTVQLQDPAYVRDGRSHNIEARVVETGRVLRGTPDSVSCPRP